MGGSEKREKNSYKEEREKILLWVFVPKVTQSKKS